MLASSQRNIRLISQAAGIAWVLAAAGLAGCGPSYPKCDNDEDCKEGEFCVNGTCQMCRDDADCPSGQRCAAGACEEIIGYCESAADCVGGEECVNNRCVEPVQSQAPEPAEPAPEPEPTQCSLEPVYFAFDSSTIDSGARDKLSSNAECIKDRGAGSLHLTGHTDPRGTEEYNLALGERRARSAKKYLKSLGVEASMSISSMGEEMASGTSESGWAQDRKVEIQIR